LSAALVVATPGTLGPISHLDPPRTLGSRRRPAWLGRGKPL